MIVKYILVFIGLFSCFTEGYTLKHDISLVCASALPCFGQHFDRSRLAHAISRRDVLDDIEARRRNPDLLRFGHAAKLSRAVPFYGQSLTAFQIFCGNPTSLRERCHTCHKLWQLNCNDEHLPAPTALDSAVSEEIPAYRCKNRLFYCLAGQRISSSWQIIDATPLMLNDWIYGNTRLLACAGEYLIVGPTWNDSAVVKARRVSQTLQPIGAAFTVPGGTIAGDGSEYFLTWVQDFTDLVGSRMTSTGTLLNPGGTLLFTDPSLAYYENSVIHDGLNWWVEWHASDDVWTMRINPAGNVLDAGGVKLPITIGGSINTAYGVSLTPRPGRRRAGHVVRPAPEPGLRRECLEAVPKPEFTTEAPRSRRINP
jgi:hypothetical protein